LRDVSEEGIATTSRLFSENVSDGSTSVWDLHFEALKRMVDRTDSDYRN
jgi:hypothetical protein